MQCPLGWRNWLAGLLASASLVLVAPGVSQAGEPKQADDAVEVVDLFDAVKAGQVETKFVARDAHQGNLLVRNLTKVPLNVRVPDAFGAVPVNAQFGGGMGGMGGGGMGGMGGGGMGGMGGGGGGGQALGGGGGMGGGMGGMGGGMGGMGMGGGMMRVAPEKTAKLVARTVCLEQGKPDPTPVMAYNIVPIEQVARDGRVVELCRMVSKGEIPTNAAQAAAWHLANGLSWEKLASLDRIRSRYTGNVKYFNAQDLQLAQQIVGEVVKRSGSPSSSEERYQTQSSPSGSVSYSQASGSVSVSTSAFVAGGN